MKKKEKKNTKILLAFFIKKSLNTLLFLCFKSILKKIKFFYLFQINIFFIFLNYFNISNFFICFKLIFFYIFKLF